MYAEKTDKESKKFNFTGWEVCGKEDSISTSTSVTRELELQNIS